ncbi:MAG TPA: HIT domain-containing protein [bacterium]
MRARRKPAADRDLPRLWAPWRSAFLSRPRQRRCIFCAAARGRSARTSRLVDREGSAFAILNRYPYNNGHLLVSPSRHIGTLLALRAEEWTDMLRLSQRLMRILTVRLHPHGFNLGVNLGKVGGAGIPGHLHLHIVPRWQGDTNFMPTVSGTKVISQSLDELYRQLSGSSRRAPGRRRGRPARRPRSRR